MTKPRSARPLVVAGGLLGCGLGALLDGILLHQVLQWHNMLSSVRPPTDLVAMKYNMLWDGLFHGAAWFITACGVAKLWAAGKSTETRWSSRAFAGAILFGWGAFNVVEGLIDHHLLGVHHVHPGELETTWDLAFLGFGSALVALGMMLVWRSASSRTRVVYTYGRNIAHLPKP